MPLPWLEPKSGKLGGCTPSGPSSNDTVVVRGARGKIDQLADRAGGRTAGEPGATLGSVAYQVGYGSPFALSAAFKRVRGISPQQYRAGKSSGFGEDDAAAAG